MEITISKYERNIELCRRLIVFRLAVSDGSMKLYVYSVKKKITPVKISELQVKRKKRTMRVCDPQDKKTKAPV